MIQVRIKRDLFLSLNSSENPQKLNTCFKTRIRREKLYNYNMPNRKEILVRNIHLQEEKLATQQLNRWEQVHIEIHILDKNYTLLFGSSFFFFFPGISITAFILFSSHWFFGDSASGYGSLSVTESLSSSLSCCCGKQSIFIKFLR